MNTIKKTIITLFVSSFLVAGSNMAYAEESVPPVAPVVKSDASEVVAHLQQGLTEAAKSDFSAATLHLKAARSSAAGITEHALEVHKGVTDINNSMKQVKLGQPEKAAAEIEKAIEIFKAL